MRILYDGQIYTRQTAGGINRYFANIISRLPQDVFPTLTTCQRQNVNYPTHPHLKTYCYRRFHPSSISYRLEKHYFRAIAAFKHFDLIHPTYYSLITQQSLECDWALAHCASLRDASRTRNRFPLVLTVHDMIHEMFYPDATDVEDKRKAILAAQAIICVSENTKKDLQERYAIPHERITVTYLASEIDASLSYGSEPVPSHPYYLYLGNRLSYKNFDGLLAVFAKVASVDSEVRLCVVGAAFNPAEQQLITHLKLGDRIENYGYISDRHLAKLYRCSVAFVYPSLYEGFGIPPLEAMSCGTVVVASNTSSIPEVVGDAGLLFDPKATIDLAEILLFLLDHPTERERFITKGYQQAKNFSWDKTTEQTLLVYRSVSK